MQKFNTIADAIALAEFAHRNQVDKAGLSYIDHPRRVLEKVRAQGALPYVQMAAILHDVTEDTAFTPKMLIELGVPESAMTIVKLLDRDYSKEQYSTFSPWENVDHFYYGCIRANPDALMVKLADIEDNTSELRLSYLSRESQSRLRDKYDCALKILKGE